ncbi:hypothetical protein TNCV_1427501 [Trichonephila clavipes]|nr:hypothetical protein TNCV_1427501 [Trichonephila clavipes]
MFLFISSVPDSDMSFQMVQQVFERIELRTVFWSGQQLNGLRMIPVFRLLCYVARNKILPKNKWSIVDKHIPDGRQKFESENDVNIFSDIQCPTNDIKMLDTI